VLSSVRPPIPPLSPRPRLILSPVAVTLLVLGTIGVVRFIRRRNRRDSSPFYVPERAMATMSGQGIPHHRQSKSLVTPPRSHHDNLRHARSRSSSLDSNATALPGPSPLRHMQYSRPFDRVRAGANVRSGNETRDTRYEPASMGSENQYGTQSMAYGNREDMGYQKDMSRSGSMMNVGSGGRA
jgi:hypothetical protein